MNFDVPTTWTFALLALAGFRIWRLLAEDTILDRPRAAFKQRVGETGETWLLCPWCCGAWLSVALWLAWVVSHHWTTVVAVPLAISAVLALVAANLDPD